MYLCGVTFLIGGDRVDSSLPYILYKDPPHLIKETFDLIKCYSYIYSTMKNLCILMFLPLFSVGISMMISRPVPCEPLVSTIEGRRYV